MIDREEVFRALETLEADRIPCYVRCSQILRKVWSERVELECENNTLREALEKIKAPQYGLELTDDDSYRAEYWSKLTNEYRQIAITALTGGNQ